MQKTQASNAFSKFENSQLKNLIERIKPLLSEKIGVENRKLSKFMATQVV